MAGASKELVDAILVNPNDQEGVTSAIVEALSMDEEEQELRITSMQASLKNTIFFSGSKCLWTGYSL